MELIHNNLNIIVTTIGAIIGSIKFSFATKNDKPLSTTIINIILGVFAGIMITLHLNSGYSTLFNIGLLGVTSLVTSALSVATLDTIIEVFPSIVRSLIKKYFKDE